MHMTVQATVKKQLTVNGTRHGRVVDRHLLRSTRDRMKHMNKKKPSPTFF